MKKYILDTSVVIKWFNKYDESDLEKALNLRYEILESKCLITIPDLLFYELGNALKYGAHFSIKEIREAVNSVFEMEFDVKTIDKTVMERAIEIGFKHNVTIYDAYFLALSQTENKPFVTADYKFIERIKSFKNVIRLADI